MLCNESINLPFYLPNWKYVLKYISEICSSYDKIQSISDIINTLRKIKRLSDGTSCTEFCRNSFLGLGDFLEKYSHDDLQSFIRGHLRQILYYVQIAESLVGHNLITLTFKNNTVNLNMAQVKSVLACSIVCIMPLRVISNIGGQATQILNVNFDEIFTAISLGSQNHINFLNSILKYFSLFCLESVDDDMKAIITLSLHRTEYNVSAITDTISSWPIILTCDLSSHKLQTNSIEHLWPKYFDNFHMSNYSGQLAFNPDEGISSEWPFLAIMIPLLTLGSADLSSSSVVKVRINDIQHILYRIQLLDPWCSDVQFSPRHIDRNIAHTCLAFQCVVVKHVHPTDSVFASTLTDSVIEDAIKKLNWNKTREIFASNRSHSHIVDSRKFDRPSYPNIFFTHSRPRESSISSSTSRSARQSYSTSSSSRSGSLQLSSFSSRRSSNKDSTDVNSTIDKSDFAGHGCHPIILEESNIQADDEDNILAHRRQFQDLVALGSDCLITETQFRVMMSAPISDSTKLSLSKDYLPMVGEKSPEIKYCSKRRNSSPIFTSANLQEPFKNQYEITRSEMKPTSRCCEVDANNDRFSHQMSFQSSNAGRRQSLPCHLHWVYGLPLTDSIKLDLSRSQLLAEDEMDEDDYNAGPHWLDESHNKCMEQISHLADGLLEEIILDEAHQDRQEALRKDILKWRYSNKFRISDDSREVGTTEDVLEVSMPTNDLAWFYKELRDAVLFDDEAMEYFRNLSDIDSSLNVSHATLCNIITSIDEDEDHNNVMVKSFGCPPQLIDHPSANHSLINYAAHLTDTIIAEAIVQGSSVSNSSQVGRYTYYAEVLAVDIIAGSLADLSSRCKSVTKSIPPLCIRPFPARYRADLSVLIQILAACVVQHQISQRLVIVCGGMEDPDVREMIDMIKSNADWLLPHKMYDALVKHFSPSNEVRTDLDWKDFLLTCFSK